MFNYETDYIIGRPTRDEQMAARIDTSDFMISGLTIQSDILFTFGFCSRVYRTKVATIQPSTKRKVSKYKSIIKKLLKFYPAEAHASVLMSERGETVSALSNEFGIDFQSVFACGANSWSDAYKLEVLMPVVAQETRSKYAKPQKFRYNFTTDDVEEIVDDYEPTQVEVDECKRIFLALQQWIQSNSFNQLSFKQYGLKRAAMESFNLILQETIFDDIREDLESFDGTIAKLGNTLDSYLTARSKSSVTGYAQTVMENECMAKQKEVAAILNSEGMAFDFDGFKYYLEMYTPAVIDNILQKYDLVLDTINSFAELREYLYAPEMMHRIRASLGVKLRPRSKNGERKSGKWMLKSYNYDERIKKLQESIGSFNEAESNQRIEDLKLKLERRMRENDEAKSARRAAKSRYDAAKRSKKQDLIETTKREYEDVVAAAVEISKSLSATKASFTKALSEFKKKKSAVEKIKEYREKYAGVLSQVKDIVGEKSVAIDKMEMMLNASQVQEDAIPYATWAFRCYGIDESVIRLITNELESSLSIIKDASGNNYINVSSHAYLDEQKNAITEFFVDYPKASKLFKAFERNKKFANAMIDAISDIIFQKLNQTVDFDCKNICVNKDMTDTLGGNDSPFDSWSL